MSEQPQLCWMLIQRGIIIYGVASYARRSVIKKMVSEARNYPRNQRYAYLSDRQFWRILKRTQGYSVCRISMQVVP